MKKKQEAQKGKNQSECGNINKANLKASSKLWLGNNIAIKKRPNSLKRTCLFDSSHRLWNPHFPSLFPGPSS